jgi:hypothetical protein
VNSARQGSVSGAVVGSAGSGAGSSSSGRTGASMALVAFPESKLNSEGKSDSPTGGSKLRVGPAFLAERFLAGSRDIFGPYWVVAVGESLPHGCVAFMGPSCGVYTAPVCCASWLLAGCCSTNAVTCMWS